MQQNDVTTNNNRKCLDIEKVRPEFKELTNELICPICFNLVYDPVCCKKCHSTYGKNCLQIWFQNNMKTQCPNSRCEFEPEEMPLIFIKVIKKIKLMCIYSECKEIINYDQFYNHLESCPFGQFRCYGIGCSFKSSREGLILHLENCSLLFQICKYCKGKFKKEHFEAHQANKDECFNKILQENRKLNFELEGYKSSNNISFISQNNKTMDKVINLDDTPEKKYKKHPTPNCSPIKNNTSNILNDLRSGISEDLFKKPSDAIKVGLVQVKSNEISNKNNNNNNLIFNDITPNKNKNVDNSVTGYSISKDSFKENGENIKFKASPNKMNNFTPAEVYIDEQQLYITPFKKSKLSIKLLNEDYSMSNSTSNSNSKNDVINGGVKKESNSNQSQAKSQTQNLIKSKGKKVNGETQTDTTNTNLSKVSEIYNIILFRYQKYPMVR